MTHVEERPAPDYRDHLEIGQNGGGDDSSDKPEEGNRELEERTIH